MADRKLSRANETADSAETFRGGIEFYRRLSGLAFGVFVAIVVLAGVLLSSEGVRVEGSFSDIGVNPSDEVWVLFCAALVFLMQAGFLTYEIGLARPQHVTAVAIKNVLDWAVSTAAFVILGFGFMFGAGSSIIGFDLFLLDGLSSINTTVTGPTFFLFQLAFAGTAITIVSGSLVERTTFLAYGSISLLLGVVIYPIYGRWVWGDALNGVSTGWLAELGFHDFAGGTVVHVVGGTVALVGVAMVGPRIGRFRGDGSVVPFAPASMGFTVLGVVLLWMGWWGFNGGSALGFGRSTAWIIVVTNIGAVAGLIGSGVLSYLFHDRADLNTKLVGGALGGLVAITPGANVLSPLAAASVGLLAGIVYAEGHSRLLRWRIDDALGVVPAHLFCGAFGTIALAIFAPIESLPRDNRISQLGVQVLGVVVCFVWSATISWIGYRVIRAVVGLRVDPNDELHGLDLERMPTFEDGDSLDEHELDALIG